MKDQVKEYTLIPTAEAAKRLGVTQHAIRRKVYLGQFKSK